MALSPIERAKADLVRINADLERTRAQIVTLTTRREKVCAYIELAEFYEGDEHDDPSMRVKGGVSGAAVRASVSAIREKGKHIHTRELIEIIGRQNIQIGGKDPVANLSGFLSRSDELKNSRALGWGLAEWGSPADETTFVALDGENLPANLSKVIQAPVAAVSSTPKASSDAARKPGASWDSPQGGDLDDEIPF